MVKLSLAMLLFYTITGYGAVPPELFSERLIDRPYTLPVGVREFDFSAGASIPFGVNTYNEYSILPAYKQALSNDYTLVWAPLPLEIQYQAIRTPTETIGASWSLGFRYTDGELSFRPTFSSSYLLKFGQNYAWDTRLFYFWDFPLGNTDSTWTGEVSSGPLFQLSDHFSLSPRLGLDLKNFVLRKMTEQGNSALPAPDFTYFVGLRAEIAGGHLWDLSSEARLDGFNFVAADSHFFALKMMLSEYW